MYTIVRVTTQLLFGLVFLAACESEGSAAYVTEDSLINERVIDTSSHNVYTWMPLYDVKNNVVNTIDLPEGFERAPVEKGTFSDWLRHLPIKVGEQDVYLYNGRKKANQTAQFAVLDIDVGKEDLQQCADAVMRLKAEYHFSKQEKRAIHFNFTSGDEASYQKWTEGYRPKIMGNKVLWTKTSGSDNTYKGFRAYMKQVFMYAGTSSLSKEMVSVNLREMQIGDVFIYGGFPGHAVIVVDMARNTTTGAKLFLLAQSYMPAQDVHILLNPMEKKSPWYSLEEGGSLQTPEWEFEKSELKRFK